MEPPSEPELTDLVLAGEIELLTALVLAATRATHHLTQDEVDEVLRLATPKGGRPRVTGPGNDLPSAGRRGAAGLG